MPGLHGEAQESAPQAARPLRTVIAVRFSVHNAHPAESLASNSSWTVQNAQLPSVLSVRIDDARFRARLILALRWAVETRGRPGA